MNLSSGVIGEFTFDTECPHCTSTVVIYHCVYIDIVILVPAYIYSL